MNLSWAQLCMVYAIHITSLHIDVHGPNIEQYTLLDWSMRQKWLSIDESNHGETYPNGAVHSQGNKLRQLHIYGKACDLNRLVQVKVGPMWANGNGLHENFHAVINIWSFQNTGKQKRTCWRAMMNPTPNTPLSNKIREIFKKSTKLLIFKKVRQDLNI